MNVLHLLVVAVAALLSQDAQQLDWRVAVTPDTVNVGTPFDVTLRVRAPAGTEIRFPAGPDSTAVARLLDPVSVTSSDSAGVVVRTAVYRLAAWDVGRHPITLGQLVVMTADGERSIPIAPPEVTVATVLPADSAARVPKPARGVFGMPVPIWFPWLPLALLAICLIAIFRWWWRRRVVAVSAPGVFALDRAQREFKRIESLRLIEAGERGRYVVLMVDALRDFLASRFGLAMGSLTSTELINVLSRDERVPVSRIGPLLHDADLIKFAQREVNSATALRFGREAVAIAQAIGNAPAAAQPVHDREDAA
jgi:hypothetical protein